MNTYDLAEVLASGAARVEHLLDARLSTLKDAPSELVEAMRYSLMAGGKRLRPLLCLAFSDLVAGGKAGKAAEDAACALEYIHTYSLIHDDLPAMDDDDLRRGQPTSHKKFGEALAILAGDALLTEAFSLLGSGPEPMRALLCVELAQAAGAVGMVGGQVLDIADARARADQAYLYRLHRKKTGALIRAACRLGVLAAGGDAEALAAADVYGDAVGLAFQIADDNLDVTAEAGKLGKPSGADAAAGRVTFPSLLGLAASRAQAAAEVDRAVSALHRFSGDTRLLAGLARYTVDREV